VQEQLQAIDPVVLLNVVRQAQGSPNFTILDSTLRVLSQKGAANPEGLWCFSGNGQDQQGVKPWSVVLKFLKNPGESPEPSHLWYWKREYLAHESGLLSQLPGPIAQARSYGRSEDALGAWLWMELLTDATDEPWGLDEYAFAAHQLGCFNAACLTGRPVPTHSWFATRHVETWLSVFPPDSAWTHPIVEQLFSPHTRTQVSALLEDKDHFLATLQRLPQVFSHLDYKRSNLFLRRTSATKKEVVAVDWGDCGIAALGADLTRLVGASTFFQDWDAAKLAELDTIAFPAYINGLQEIGWTGDPDVVRLAYTTWFALDWACTAPSAVAFAAETENRAFIERITDSTPEAMTENVVALCEFSLERAEEARQLMGHLKWP
jgi:hypothetical protein